MHSHRLDPTIHPRQRLSLGWNLQATLQELPTLVVRKAHDTVFTRIAIDRSLATVDFAFAVASGPTIHAVDV